MKIVFISLLVCLFISCKTTVSLFTKRCEREKYKDQLVNAGLAESVLYKAWQQQAEKALVTPLFIKIPYRETGYFSAKEPLATGYKFSIKQGQQLTVALTKSANGSAKFFCDLFTLNGREQKYVSSVDSTNGLVYEAEANDTLVIRLQPELLLSVNYTLTVTVSASLAFPVAPTGKKYNIGSFWGANRDAGARRHEGIDIFSSFRTPVVAAADGVVTRVGENTLGGKIIFMRPGGKSYSLYYAHLDSQIAQEGQHVLTGDTLGLMGNTGNARTTPTHLHFGIYTLGGAVDPLPFINADIKQPAPVAASVDNISNNMRNISATRISKDDVLKNDSLLQAHSFLYIQSATGNMYKFFLPDGTAGFIKSNLVESAEKAYKTYNVSLTDTLFEEPFAHSPYVIILSGEKNVQVKAEFKNYYYVQSSGISGWLKK